MITKKIMPLLLILALIWQGTALYGMNRLVTRQYEKSLSGRLLKTLTQRRSFCSRSEKEFDCLNKKINFLKKDMERDRKITETLQKETNSFKKRMDSLDRLERFEETVGGFPNLKKHVLLNTIWTTGLSLEFCYRFTINKVRSWYNQEKFNKA